MDNKVVVFKDLNNKILYITDKIKEISLTEMLGNLSYLNLTILKDLPHFFSNNTADILDAEYIEIFDNRLQKIRKYKINTLERDQEGTKFTETIEAESVNYAKYQNKYVKVVLPIGYTLNQCLNAVLIRDGFFNFTGYLGMVEEDATQGLVEQKEYSELPLLEVLDDLQKTFQRFLLITDDYKINYLQSIGKTADVNYIYGLNYTSIKQKIDKSKVVNRIIGKGKDNLTFSSINSNKEYVEVPGWTADTRNFEVLEDMEETSKADLLRKTKAELDKKSKPIMTYQITTSFISKNPNLQINENYGIGDIVKIYNPYFYSKGIEQKVVEMVYNPLYPWIKPQLTLGEKQYQLIEFLQDATREIKKIKRRLTS